MELANKMIMKCSNVEISVAVKLKTEKLVKTSANVCDVIHLVTCIIYQQLQHDNIFQEARTVYSITCSVRCCIEQHQLPSSAHYHILQLDAQRLIKFLLRTHTLKFIAGKPVSVYNIVLKNLSCNSKLSGNQSEIPIQTAALIL